LGGGSAAGNEKPTHKGLDLTLPEPKLDNHMDNKLSLYEQAEQRARRLKDAKAADPYSRDLETDSINNNMGHEPYDDEYGEYPLITHTNVNNALDESSQTEAKLRRQLAELKAQINTTSNWKQESDDSGQEDWLPATEKVPDWQPTVTGAADASLQPTADPELQQLDNMLTKILDIEHPQRVKERLQQQSMDKRGLVFPVETKPDIPKADLLQPQNKAFSEPSGNAFYESENIWSAQNETAIPAVVHETQTLVSGATLKLRLTEDVFINGIQVPAGTFIYGLCSLDGERLIVDVKHIRYRNTLLPVKLSVFDIDGIAGIRIPGAISRNAAKQGMTNGIQSMDFYSMNPSLGAQAASAGIQTVKSLLGNKAKLIKATVRAGYPVLLMDNNKRNQ
jgi:conjugative transposon TraM protein